MKLIYLWIDNYKNIKQTGFNFTSDFHCEYNHKTLSLSAKKNGTFNSFFGEYINITAIVGKNGSGKTSILEVLQKNLVFDIRNFQQIYEFDFLLVFSDDDSENLKISTNISDINYDKNFFTRVVCESLYDYFSTLFLDSALPYNNFNEYDSAAANFPVIPDFDTIKEHQFADIDYNSICKKTLKLVDISNDLVGFSPTTISILPDYKSLDKIKNKTIYDYHKRPIFADSVIELMDDLLEKIHDPEDLFIIKLFFQVIDDYDDKKIEADLLKIIKKDCLNLKLIITEYFDDRLKAKHNEYNNIFCKNAPIKNINYIKIEKYYDYIDIEIFDEKNRSFYSLSHGEKIIFGIEINIVHFLLDNADNDNFLLCFDEPDISLHPEWQRNYLSIIIEILNKTKKNIHFIFSTHSPFMLSDLPKQNVLFLDKNEDGMCKLSNGLSNNNSETFGANIHTLLTDSFFMGNGLVGKFAQSKIYNIIAFNKKLEERSSDLDALKEEYEEKKELFNYTKSIIGEEYLRNIIENHLLEIEKILYGKDKAKENRVKALENEIKKLKNV